MSPEELGDVEDPAVLEAMNSGFNEASTATTPTTPPAKEVEPEKAAVVPPKEETPPAAEPPAPEYVQITKDQLASFESAAARVTDFEKKLDRALGTFGNVQQIVKDLQAATPKGFEVALPDDVVAEMEAEFPEIAVHLRPALEKALKGIKGTGGAPAAGLDQDAIKTLVSEGRISADKEALEDAYPDWMKIVAKPAEEGQQIDPNSPFRKWLAGEPAEYQEKINSTHNPAVLHRALDRFHASQKTHPVTEPTKLTPPKEEGPDRRGRLLAATQPKGAGGNPPPAANSEAAAFDEGFKSG